MTEPSIIERIKNLHRQGYSLTEAKRTVHASLSDEEQANVERLWEELEVSVEKDGSNGF